jgi:membrane protein DedA with SNARE-associated domain
MHWFGVLAAWALPPAAVALVDVEAAKTLAAVEGGVFLGGELGAMTGALFSSNEGDDAIGSVFLWGIAGAVAGGALAYKLVHEPEPKRNPRRRSGKRRLRA